MNLLDLLFPKICLGCGSQGGYFCIECKQKIRKTYQICPICSKPSPFGRTHNFCLTKFSLESLFSFFAYGGIIREAIHKLKYKLVTDLEQEFWRLIKDEIGKKEIEMTVLNQNLKIEKPTVVPIPLYWYKQNLRGFNQSSLFGKRIACLFDLPFSDKILVREKNTVSQTKLTQKEREQNIKGIFSLAPDILISQDLNILLIDDVWTTGSTMKEAARVLRGAGAKKVWGLTVAR